MSPFLPPWLIGARTDEQLADNLAAADFALTPEERTKLDAASAPPSCIHTGIKRERHPTG